MKRIKHRNLLITFIFSFSLHSRSPESPCSMEPSIFLPKPKVKKAKVAHPGEYMFSNIMASGRNKTMHAPETNKQKWHASFIKHSALPEGVVDTTYDDPEGVVAKRSSKPSVGEMRACPPEKLRPTDPLPPRGECRWLALAKRCRSPSPEPRPQAVSSEANDTSPVRTTSTAADSSSLDSAKALVKSIHEQMISNSRCIVRSSTALTSGRHDIRSSLQALRTKVSFAQNKLKEYTKNGGSLVIDGITYTQFDAMFASHGPLGSYGIGNFPTRLYSTCRLFDRRPVV